MRVLKYLGFLILGIICALAIYWWIFDEDLPQGKSGPEADAIALSMMQAVNKAAWDSIPIIQWTFKDLHTFQWDKVNHLCLVTWDQYKVKLNINNQTGVVHLNGALLEGTAAQEKVKEAWDYFNNDSFWLNAVVKAFDPGTSRSLVTLKDGRQGLKIHYNSGGSTPGDSYVWILDENQRPISWKMWVAILPVSGMEFTWEDWLTLPGGAQVATTHKYTGLNLNISNLQAAHDWPALGYSENPLREILE